ncbi:MAG TPA: 50S ribosomal protein L10 [Candidatus Woesebacteria bacterium]|nr:50S ribosomal protein L10 [Candidatus Woesebacteria bacterium]
MAKTNKIEKVDQVVKELQSAKSAALIQYQGLTAGDVANLRAKVKSNGGIIKVVKNTLITRALLKLGINLPETLTGPTAIAFSNSDEIAPLKDIDSINKEKEKTSFKYGIYNHKLLLATDLQKFLSLPSKTQLIAQFIGGLKNPLQRMVYAMRFNQQQLVMTLKAVADKQK